jgi:hypothetical protein
VTDRRAAAVMWFGVFAPPLAWAVQLLAGWLVDEAACSRGSLHWGIDDRWWQAIISLVAAAAAAAGAAAAFTTLRSVRRGVVDPRGRVEFLALTSLSAALLFLLLTLITGIAVVSLESCRG